MSPPDHLSRARPMFTFDSTKCSPNFYEEQINNQPSITERYVPGTVLTSLRKFSLENILNIHHMGYQKQAHLIWCHSSRSTQHKIRVKCFPPSFDGGLKCLQIWGVWENPVIWVSQQSGVAPKEPPGKSRPFVKPDTPELSEALPSEWQSTAFCHDRLLWIAMKQLLVRPRDLTKIFSPDYRPLKAILPNLRIYCPGFPATCHLIPGCT